jgi:hypothetical protein
MAWWKKLCTQGSGYSVRTRRLVRPDLQVESLLILPVAPRYGKSVVPETSNLVTAQASQRRTEHGAFQAKRSTYIARWSTVPAIGNSDFKPWFRLPGSSKQASEEQPYIFL